MRSYFFVVIMSVLLLGGCNKPIGEVMSQPVDREPKEEQETKEEEITAMLDLISLYELDIKCLKDSSVKHTCNAIHDEKTFGQAIEKIEELQDRLLEEYDYKFESEFINSAYSDYVTIIKEPVKEGTCKEIEGAYTSQGLMVTSCGYSSSKDKISITIYNNSGVDLRYIRVEIYGMDSNGNTVSSDYTNHSSTIRDGASQTLETYVDKTHSYEVEITDVSVKR